MSFLGPFLDHPYRSRCLSLAEGHVGHLHPLRDRQRLHLRREPAREIEAAKVKSDSEACGVDHTVVHPRGMPWGKMTLIPFQVNGPV